MLSFFIIAYVFNKIGEAGRTGSAWKQGWGRGGEGHGGEMAQTTYAHMNKWTNKP
jgi:hypothetical protein